MARSKAESHLTLSQIGRIRASQARKVTGILNRVALHAQGELKNQHGDPVEMTRSQLDAAKLLCSVVLPAQQSVQMEDITETPQDKAAVEKAYNDAMAALRASLKPEDIKTTLAAMDKDTRQALIDSLEATSQ